MEKEQLRVGVIGASGYAGTELLRLLHQHPFANVNYVAGNHGEEDDWATVRPYFPKYHHLQMKKYDLLECLENCDLAFVALPSGASGEIATQLWREGLRVIDLSGDLRLAAKEYEQWYGREAPGADALTAAVYGLTEWKREEIATAQLVSNPGCYATAILLALKPLAHLPGINAAMPIVIDAKSGISGAGKKPNPNFLYGELDDNFYAYKVGAHQHTPEVQRYLGVTSPVLMTTQLLPTARGIYAVSYLQLEGAPLSDNDVYECYQEVYKEEPFITIHPPNHVPQLKHVRASNHCHIGFHVDKRTQVLQVFSTIDNLQKGAAGQAVQNMNVVLGYEETLGLTELPVYP